MEKKYAPWPNQVLFPQTWLKTLIHLLLSQRHHQALQLDLHMASNLNLRWRLMPSPHPQGHLRITCLKQVCHLADFFFLLLSQSIYKFLHLFPFLSFPQNMFSLSMIFLKMQHAGDRVRFIGLSSGGLYPTASSSRYNSCKMLTCSSISPF